MKKTILTLAAFVALTLAACNQGGNNNAQNAQQQTAEPATPAEVPAEPQPSEVVETEPEATFEEVKDDKLDEVTEKFTNFLKNLPATADKKVYYFDENLSNDEGFSSDNYYYAYPIDGGGYLAIISHAEAAEGTGGYTDYYTYTFKDGKLTRVKNVLPTVTDINSLINTDIEADNADGFKALRAAFAKNSADLICYVIYQSDPEIRPELRPLDYDNPDWDDAYYDYLKDLDDLPSYVWNGKKFVAK